MLSDGFYVETQRLLMNVYDDFACLVCVISDYMISKGDNSRTIIVFDKVCKVCRHREHKYCPNMIRP